MQNNSVLNNNFGKSLTKGMRDNFLGRAVDWICHQGLKGEVFDD